MKGPTMVDLLALEIRRLNNLDDAALYVPGGIWDRIIYNGDFRNLVLPEGYYITIHNENGKSVHCITNKNNTGDATYWSFYISSGVDEFVTEIRRKNPELGYKNLQVVDGGWNSVIYSGDPKNLFLPEGFYWEVGEDSDQDVKRITNKDNVDEPHCRSFNVIFAVEEIVREIRKINNLKEGIIRVKPGCWMNIIYKGDLSMIKLPNGFKVIKNPMGIYCITDDTNFTISVERG